MTVFSKLLLGTVHIKSYDWVDPVNLDTTVSPSQCEWLSIHSLFSLWNEHSKPWRSCGGWLEYDCFTVRLAKLKADSVFTAPCDTSVLYPTTGGNIHAFSAITPCAMLDVIGPPYSNKDGRDCSYYKEYPYTASSKWKLCALITLSCYTHKYMHIYTQIWTFVYKGRRDAINCLESGGWNITGIQ